MAATKKRLFISTKKELLQSIVPKKKLSQFMSLVRTSFTILPVDNSDVESATLFLISQDLSDSSTLSCLQIGSDGFEDYLLYHKGHTKDCIITLFGDRTQAGHHERYVSTNGIEYRAFAEALQVILDDTTPANKKAATIINIIWPDKSVLKKEVQKLLSSYKRGAPASNAECPSVFSTIEMKTAFDELKLKGKSIDDRDSYSDSLAK